MENKKTDELERHEIKLTYDSLIAILQGKEFHLMTFGKHFVFYPPFDGIFLTHEELYQLRLNSYHDSVNALYKFQKYVEDRRK
jgi:hypothetical protein